MRLIVPFPPGGGGDALARPLAQRLSEVWGQQVIVENRGGAGGNVGAYQAANAPADGYTLLLGAAFLSINPMLYPASGYNPFTDLAPVSLLTVHLERDAGVEFVAGAFGREFIDYAKANRGSVTFASTGIGASPHLSGELFKRMAGIEMTHVPYRGAGPAMNDLMPGRVSAMFSNLPGVIPQILGKSVRGLAVTSRRRVAAVPDIPTIGETVPGYEVESLVGPVRSRRDTARHHRKAACRHGRRAGARVRSSRATRRSARRSARPRRPSLRHCCVWMPRNGPRSSGTPASSRSRRAMPARS